MALEYKLYIYYGYLGYLRPFVTFNGLFVNLVAIWDIFTVLVCCSKKNLATLIGMLVCLTYLVRHAPTSINLSRAPLFQPTSFKQHCSAVVAVIV
jgi:hypothetical protein